MKNEQVYEMLFARVWPLLEQKALKKGRTHEEVIAVATWLTGYRKTTFAGCLRTAPAMGISFEMLL